MSEMYAEYRLESVKISMLARETTFCNLAVYFNLPTAAAPTTVEEMEDLPFYAQGSGLFGCPLPVIELKKKDLDHLRQVKWFNTFPSSVDNEFEFQFEIWSYAPFATLNHIVRIEYVVALNGSTDPSQSVMNRTMPWRERQKLARRKNAGIVTPLRLPLAESKYEEGSSKTLSHNDSDQDDLVVLRDTSTPPTSLQVSDVDILNMLKLKSALVKK